MLTDRNQLPEPEAIARPAFDDLVTEFQADYLANIRATDATLADQVEATLQQPGELLTKMSETFVQYLLNEIERRNQQAKQLLPGWAQGTNLDNLVAHQGITRQVIDEGDSAAYPPVPPTMEADDSLLLRYLLQPHAPAAGSAMQYKASILTLDEKPSVTVDKPSDNQVRVTYTFNPQGIAAQIKDGNGLRTAPGQVQVTVLAREGDGTASDVLLQAVTDYFARDDVSPGTDDISVQGAEIINYTQTVKAYIGNGPDTQITEQSITEVLQAYADEQHRLGGEIRPDYISHLLYQQGVKRGDIEQPTAAIECQPHQAPYCTAINVEVLRL